MPKQEEKIEKVTVSPAEIWGKVITELRNRNLRLLFIACGEIDSVEIKDNNFVITAQDNNRAVIDIPENLKILQEIISFYLPNCTVCVKEEISEDDLIVPSLKLIELFGNKLIIGEKKNGNEF